MKADQRLEELNVDFQRIEQDRPTLKCSEAADERNVEVSQIVKSLIVKKGGELYHLCLPGDREVSEGKFGEYRLVDEERSEQLTGQKSGTVHPFSSDLEHIIDERVFEKRKVSFTAGTETEAVKLEAKELEDALEKAEFEYSSKDIVVSNEEDLEALLAAGADSEQARFLSENGYRRIFIDLSEEFDSESVVDTIREFERNKVEAEKEVLEEILRRSENQTHMQKIVENYAEKGEIHTGDDFNLQEVVDDVVEGNQDAVEDYRSGTESALNYLLGQVMQHTKGKADGGKTKKLLIEKL